MHLGGPKISAEIGYISLLSYFIMYGITQDTTLLVFRHKLQFSLKFGVFLVYIKHVFLGISALTAIAKFNNFTIIYPFISISSYLENYSLL